MFQNREFVEAGGLISYAPNTVANYRRAAVFVDKILKGARPEELPIEQPTQFELVINIKTAKALGLTIPPSLLLRADQVINEADDADGDEPRIGAMTDLQRFGFALIGFAVAVVVAGVLLGLIAAWITKNRGGRDARR